MLDARSVPSAGLVAGGSWSVRVPAYDGLKFNAVVRGTAWIAVDGTTEPIRLTSGDCFMLTKGSPFVLASDLDLPPVDAAIVFADTRGGLARIGDEEDCVIVGGKMTLDTVAASLLVDALPAVIHLSAESEGAASVRWLLERLQSERDSLRPGGDAVASHLLHMLFIELMRAHLLTAGVADIGWIGALRDRRLSSVISALHEEPAKEWTLPELAAIANMSRSNFALRFRTQVGVSPLEYLTRWRMQLARHALVHRTASVGEVASYVGYASESAFGAAFRRIFGQSPKRYRSSQRPV